MFDLPSEMIINACETCGDLTFSLPSNSEVFAADLKDTVLGSRLLDTRFHVSVEPLLSGHLGRRNKWSLIKEWRVHFALLSW